MKPYMPDALDRREPELIAKVLPVLEAVNQHYFRSSCEGLEHVDGSPAMFVSNHNGGMLGPDFFCTLGALWRVLTPESPLYALAPDFAMRQFKPLGRLLQRFGAIPATPANALRVLRGGGQVLVYPDGHLRARHVRRRSVEPRTGFVEVARRAKVPIVPIVAYGAHHGADVFRARRAIAERFGAQRWAGNERLPLAFALRWLLSAGPWLPFLPLPVRVRIRVLPPVTVPRAEAAPHVAERIQTRMQLALGEMLA
ncbi:MAG TPA: 1-acyl-sn-glycerol-3-phosphate acyltransferase [Polyangiaceae bacterium]|nr:1-acyl-sn-glycerol-3-phosphate acyltransferase [Polyangiaceae bacterium]